MAHQPPDPGHLTELQTLCDTYQQWYNTTRRHSAWNCPPAQAWADAPAHGGPGHLPIQQDATVHTLTVTARGVIVLAKTHISVGRHRTGQTITALRDGDHVIAYGPDGTILGHLHLDHTKRYQGQLRPAA
jgi:putative transposase